MELKGIIIRKVGKKGILFTFLSVVIAALLSMIYSGYQITPIDNQLEVDKFRVENTNQYLLNVFAYSESSLRTAGYLAMQEMIDYIDENDFYSSIAEVNRTFQEAVINGTINGLARDNLQNNTINKLFDKMENVTRDELGMTLDINATRVWIDQTEGFTLTAYVETQIYLENTNVKWNITNVSSTTISIEGLKDPYYFAIGYDSYFKESNVLQEKFNSTQFETFVNESHYFQTPYNTLNISGEGTFRSMSFFARLVNDSSIYNSNTLTIFSIVSPQALIDAGIPQIMHPDNVSYADFMYFTEMTDSGCASVLKKVKNTTNRPVIDRFHLELIFNLTNSQIEDTDTC